MLSVDLFSAFLSWVNFDRFGNSSGFCRLFFSVYWNLGFFRCICFSLCWCAFCLHLCLYMYNIHDWCMLRSEEEVRSSKIGIYCDSPCEFYILNQSPLQEQQVFLTMKHVSRTWNIKILRHSLISLWISFLSVLMFSFHLWFWLVLIKPIFK